jgi:transposase
MAEQYKDSLASVVNFLVDGGYSGEKFATGIKELLAAAVQVAKRNELHTFEVIPQRWIVERSWARLEKCRRLWKNCERKLSTSKQMIVLAFLAILMRRL